MDYSKIIMIEPGKKSGKPCTRGMKMLFDQNLSFKLVSAVRWRISHEAAPNPQIDRSVNLL